MDLGTDIALVTGAAGWLGVNFVLALKRGLPDVPRLAEAQANLRVRGLVLPGTATPALASSGAEVVEGDITHPADCKKFCDNARGGVLFHIAGIIHPAKVSDFFRINVAGTRNILNAAVDAGVRRAVVVSSNSPFGCNRSRDDVFDESSPFHPYKGYGKSKMQMEQVVGEFQKSGKIETVILRVPWFYGPNQPARQKLFFEMVRDGNAPIVGGGKNRRSMGYVGNTSQGLLLAAITPGANGQAYWIADKRAYSMNEIVDTIEDLMRKEFNQNCTGKRMKLPGFASSVASMVDSMMQGVGMYHQKIHVLSEMNKTIACSIAKAERELGYQPTVELREGMRRSLSEVFGQTSGVRS